MSASPVSSGHCSGATTAAASCEGPKVATRGAAPVGEGVDAAAGGGDLGAVGAVDSPAVDSPEALGRVAISSKSYEYEKRTKKCGRRQRGSENHLKYAEEK